MIWIKRLSPIVIILAAYFFYDWYSARQASSQTEDIDRYASVTAEIWIGSAIYRNHPEQFLAYRDSLLSAHDMSAMEIGSFLDRKHQTPEEYLDFVESVNAKVDSIQKLGNLPELDSLLVIDSAKADLSKE